MPSTRWQTTLSNSGPTAARKAAPSIAMACTLALLLACNGDRSVQSTAPEVTFSDSSAAQPALRVQFATSRLHLALLGDTATLSPEVVDRTGRHLRSSEVKLELVSGTAVQVIPGSTRIVATERGTATLLASAGKANATLEVIVDPAAPRPLRIVGDTVRPGVKFAIDGDAFALRTADVHVHVNGMRADIVSASRTRIEAVLQQPVPCQVTGNALVRVTVAGAHGDLQAPLRVAQRITLEKGESANLLDAADAACAELVGETNGGRAKFVLAVINTSAAASASSAFELHGTAGGNLTGVRATNLDQNTAADRASASATSSATLPTALRRSLETQGDHSHHLDRQRAVARGAGSPVQAWRAASARQYNAAMDHAPLNVGDIVTMRAPFQSCNAARAISARVVYAGSRAVVLEDVAAPRARTMDAEYRALGEEFDAVQYPMLVQNIGDPLAMNDAMNGDGRVTMLFTRYVNDSLPNVGGYVSVCNFYPKSTFAASNEDEVFYARVADAQQSPAEWRRLMRTVVVHEAKHLASFAERLARGHQFEESWLEESTARIAEELYARTLGTAGAWKSNTTFASSVRCEIYQCGDRPLVMWQHFSTLHSYYRGVDTLTPLGPVSGGDFTYYSSGWSLVRWAADQYASNEGAWLKALVRGGASTGLAHLSAATGRPVGEMLADWALARAVDDLPGFTPNRQQLTMPSWNTAEILQGLATTYPSYFTASPLQMRNYTFGEFVLPVGKLPGFSTSYFSFSGNQTGSQLVELKGEGGGQLPAGVRLAVVRVE